jgi:hypothetical protein
VPSPKFIRDSMYIDDIKGTRTKPIYKGVAKSILSTRDIEGSMSKVRLVSIYACFIYWTFRASNTIQIGIIWPLKRVVKKKEPMLCMPQWETLLILFICFNNHLARHINMEKLKEIGPKLALSILTILSVLKVNNKDNKLILEDTALSNLT